VRCYCLATLALILPSLLSSADLQGRVKIDGKIPTLKLKKKAYSPYASVYKSADPKPMPETAKQLLVYLEGVPGSYKAPAKAPLLGQKDKLFSTNIVPVISGGKVEISNQDSVFHHIRSSTKPWAFNLNRKGPGESVSVAFEPKKDRKTGVVPIYCDIHPKMRTHVVVLDSPYYALLNETGGNFSIKNVPPGSYTLNAFHPTLKFTPFKVSVGKGKQAKPVLVTMVGEKSR
jgi:plastocyanin